MKPIQYRTRILGVYSNEATQGHVREIEMGKGCCAARHGGFRLIDGMFHCRWLLVLLAGWLFCPAGSPADDSAASKPGILRGLVRGDSEDEIIRGLVADGPALPFATVEWTIVSYNVQARPALDDVEEKLPLIAPRLNPFDVVLIQECFARHDLLFAGANFPNKVFFGRLLKPTRFTGSGLATLTRFPIGEIVSEHYRDVGELQNRVACKGILMTRLRIGGFWVDVYNTHMEAGDTAPAQQARRGQARQVIEFVEKHSPTENTVLLMGDFNMGPRRPDKTWEQYSPRHYSTPEDLLARTEAFETMFRGLRLTDASDQLHGETDDGIERLLFRPGSNAKLEVLEYGFDGRNFRRADGTSLSDGSPLIARLRISPR